MILKIIIKFLNWIIKKRLEKNAEDYANQGIIGGCFFFMEFGNMKEAIKHYKKRYKESSFLKRRKMRKDLKKFIIRSNPYRDEKENES